MVQNLLESLAAMTYIENSSVSPNWSSDSNSIVTVFPEAINGLANCLNEKLSLVEKGVPTIINDTWWIKDVSL